MIAPADMNLDELRMAAAPLVPEHAAFDGWSDGALAMAAETLGVPAARLRLAFPAGQVDMIDAWFDSVDRAMLAVVAVRVAVGGFARAASTIGRARTRTPPR